MKTRPRHRRSAGTRRPSGWPAARDDARRLAIEIGRGQPDTMFDAMAAGVVLKQRETAYRQVPVWLIAFDHGHWASPSPVQAIVTDQRLICRLTTAQLASLPWCGVIGLHVDLPHARVTLDDADGMPIMICGAAAPTIAVSAVAFTYGPSALLTHPALDCLRSLRHRPQSPTLRPRATPR